MKNYYLHELNYRLLYTLLGLTIFFLTLYNYKQGIIYTVLPQGLLYFITTDLTEIFISYIQLCSFFTLGIGLFLVPIQIYWFLRPGLYEYESKIILRFLFATTILYFFTYMVIAPAAIKFFWNIFIIYAQEFSPVNLTFEPRLSDYLKHILQVYTLIFFMVPCLLVINLVQKNTSQVIWVKYRGFIYLVIFSFAALITPPDLLSQFLIGLPLIVLYEIQIFLWCLITAYKKY